MLGPKVNAKAKSHGMLWLGVVVVLGGSALYCWPWSAPKSERAGHPLPRFTLGRETTYYTGPLDVDGFPDYEEAINRQMAQGIDPAENAVAVLQRALGPSSDGQTVPSRFYEWLQITPPDVGGGYFVRYSDWVRPREQVSDDKKMEPLPLPLPEEVFKKPWQANQYPRVFQWLKFSEPSLNVAIEASKKKQFFHPLVNPEKGTRQGGLKETPIPTIAMARDLSNALICRAMLLIGTGKFEEARQDLLACRRLARLMQSNLGTTIQYVVAIRIEIEALAAAQVLLDKADFSKEALKEWQAQWAAVPLPIPIIETFDRVERVIPLQMATSINQLGADSIFAMIERTNVEDIDMFKELTKSFNHIYFDQVLSTVNRGADRLAAAGRMAHRGEREKALADMEQELDSSIASSRSVLQQFQSGIFPSSPPGDALGEMFGQFLLKKLILPCWQSQRVADQGEEANRLFSIAMALAIHQREKGTYPARLQDLKPPLDPSVLEDRYSGKPHVYRKTWSGCLLYSVGPNGKDDGGRGPGDWPAGDDRSVRMAARAAKP